jgi:ABC-type transport system substrate-binding protein
MLALYRSGRQGEALTAFDRARRTLADELGVEPGTTLSELHRRMLVHDQELVPAATRSGPTDPSEPERGRRLAPRTLAIAGVVLLTLAAALGALLALDSGDAPDAVASKYAPGTVLVDLESGNRIDTIPHSALSISAYPLFARGRFWVNNFEPGSYVQIDPRRGRMLKTITAPPWDPRVHADSATETPFAVEGGRLWTSSADDLVSMDIESGRQIARYRLDDYAGGGRGLAEGVAVGAGSVWVSRDVAGGQVLRLDPATGRVERRWEHVAPHNQLAFGEGSLWLADDRGVARIDAGTGALTFASGLRGTAHVVAGGGFGWATDPATGLVHQIDRAGHVVRSQPVGLGARFLSYSDGTVWVGSQDEGTVTGIDAATAEIKRYRFGRQVGTIATGGGVLLVDLERDAPIEERIAALDGRVARLFAHTGQLGQGDEPALDEDPGAYQVWYATCAKLLNYSGGGGGELRPEVAAAMPSVSHDGRTYTFRVRRGYRFSPPSGQPVTAETFRYSIERALSPKLTQSPQFPTQDPPGPRAIPDIAGERAFRLGAADHIAGLRVRGRTLEITLTKPSPDFLARLSLPYFCPVPVGTPFVAGAPVRDNGVVGGGSISSAGPYYVAEYSNAQFVILRRNRNYGGRRPQHLDAIALREGVAPSAAFERVGAGDWDGTTSLEDPALEPGGLLAERWGLGSAAARRGDQRAFFTPKAANRVIAFNSAHGIFQDPDVRLAASLALDRRALARAWGVVAVDQLLSPALPAYRDRRLYPLRPSLDRARSLMHGRRGTAVLPVPVGCDRCREAAEVVRAGLAAIGIRVELERVLDAETALRSGEGFDVADLETGILYPDSASFLATLASDMPAGWMAPSSRDAVREVAATGGRRRQPAAAALADRLVTRDIPLAAYGVPGVAQFAGPRIGCRRFSSFGYGLDLAAICLEG